MKPKLSVRFEFAEDGRYDYIAAIQFLALIAYPDGNDRGDEFVIQAKAHITRVWAKLDHPRALELRKTPLAKFRTDRLYGSGQLTAVEKILIKRIEAAEFARTLIANKRLVAMGLDPIAPFAANVATKLPTGWDGMTFGIPGRSGKPPLAGNWRTRIWKPSLPVLHLAIALYEHVFVKSKLYEENGPPLVLQLLINTTWVKQTVLAAERLRLRGLMPEEIPVEKFIQIVVADQLEDA